MAVPKKKVSRVRTKRRYATHVKRVQNQLADRTNLVSCTNCGAQKLSHHMCNVCGYYGKRKVMDVTKNSPSVTKIEA